MKHTARCLMLGAALAASLPVLAQYSWIDGAGRRVFSDQPPPANIPQQDILSERPTPTSAPAAPASPASPAWSATGSQDPALEEKKRAAAEAVPRDSGEAQQLEVIQRVDNCQRARTALVGLQSGARIAQLDAQGQRVYMPPPQRAAEIQRLLNIIDSDCR
jgi:hypothetical protein